MYDAWEPPEFVVKDFKNGPTYLCEGESVENNQTLLDDHLIKTQGMKGSPFALPFLDEIIKWETTLITTQENLELWTRVQGVWLYLEPVFSSEDILKQMPVEGNIFRQVDQSWKQLMQQTADNCKAFEVMKFEDLGKTLAEANKKLEEVQKGLNNYLEGKRGLFPRFCFLSDGELLEILSETKEPLKVQPHLKKCFEGIAALEFDDEKKIHGMYSSEDEYVPFVTEIDPNASKGNVEDWLCKVEDIMLRSVKDTCEKALKDYQNKERDKWITSWQGQAVLCVSQIFWTSLAEEAMKKSGVSGLASFFELLQVQVSLFNHDAKTTFCDLSL
jgi:dynein heavy chain